MAKQSVEVGTSSSVSSSGEGLPCSRHQRKISSPAASSRGVISLSTQSTLIVGELGVVVAGSGRTVEHHGDQAVAVSFLEFPHELREQLFHRVLTSRWKRRRRRNRRRRSRRNRLAGIEPAESAAAAAAPGTARHHVTQDQAGQKSPPPPPPPLYPRGPPARSRNRIRKIPPITTGHGMESEGVLRTWRGSWRGDGDVLRPGDGRADGLARRP